MRVALIALLVSLASIVHAQEQPDFSGWWLSRPDGLPPLITMLSKPPAMRPELLPALRSSLTEMVSGAQVLDHCRPNQYVGFLNGAGFEDALELLFTRGRVTLTSADGLIRRIYMDGRPLPEEPDPTYTGMSVGRWEGTTLVVETSGFAPWLRFPVRAPGAPRIGAHAHVVERYQLTDANTLVIRSVLTAPELLTAPYEMVMSYTREPDREIQEVTICSEEDRLVDRATGSVRFDLTPPEGLPPPPGTP